MIRQHEQANLQVCVFMFVLSFVCSVIKYKIARSENKFDIMFHINCRIIVTVQELRMFVMLLYCI